MATLTVGLGQQFSTIAAAVAASHDGDVLAIQAGTYTNDFATINTKITLQGVGGMARLVATVPPPNGKGILVTNTDVTLDNLEFAGAKVADMNGAGVRYQGGNLTITDSYFHDNQNGVLANPSATGSITIRTSEFANNGAGDGQSHNLYVGAVGTLTIADSYFHDAVLGHEIKSRALNTTITNTRIVDGTSTASYSIDLPNGGKVLLANNLIEQGPNSQNPAIVSFGAEGSLHAGSGITMTDNVIINDLAASSARMLNNHTTTSAAVAGTDVWGLSASQLVWGPAGVIDTAVLAGRPSIDTSSPWLSAVTVPGIKVIGTRFADTLAGGAGNDTLDGGTANDRISGDGGADWIVGGTGADILDGGAGNDRIIGGAGADTLTGGQGADTFVYQAMTDRADRITDFNAAAGDRLDVGALLGAFGHDYATLASGGFVKLVQGTTGVTVRVDPNGGGDAYVNLVTLDGTKIIDLGSNFLFA